MATRKRLQIESGRAAAPAAAPAPAPVAPVAVHAPAPVAVAEPAHTGGTAEGEREAVKDDAQRLAQ